MTQILRWLDIENECYGGTYHDTFLHVTYPIERDLSTRRKILDVIYAIMPKMFDPRRKELQKFFNNDDEITDEIITEVWNLIEINEVLNS